MERDNEAGEALEGVARIHPVLDRLRRLLESATILDMKATRRQYWADRYGEGDRALSSDAC